MALLSALFFFLFKILRRLTGPSPSSLYSHVGNSTTEGQSSGTLEILDRRTGRRYKLPISNNAIEAVHLGAITASNGLGPIDHDRHGLRVLDPGFRNTAVTKSHITLVDGIKGTIQYRQYPIDDLVGRHDFEEVAHLLIWGNLPTSEEKAAFRTELNMNLNPPQLVINAVRNFPPDAPPFSMILAGLAAYAASDPASVPTAANKPSMYRGDTEVIDRALIRTISSMAVVLALTYCRQHDCEIAPPTPGQSFISNVLLMMGFVDQATRLPSPTVVGHLERLWVLYCDHEMTNSTAAFLHVASTLADPISCCSAFIASANGPLHGGAIDLAYKAFANLGTPERVPALIADVKAKKYRLSGYGHRIYKTVDPRTRHIRAMLDEQHADASRRPNALLAVALEIDRLASTEEYFTSRNLKANADLYGCFVYTALGFEPDIIAALMMLSRMPGVMAHWREAMIDQESPLWRPQQVYVGAKAG